MCILCIRGETDFDFYRDKEAQTINPLMDQLVYFDSQEERNIFAADIMPTAGPVNTARAFNLGLSDNGSNFHDMPEWFQNSVVYSAKKRMLEKLRKLIGNEAFTFDHDVTLENAHMLLLKVQMDGPGALDDLIDSQ